MRNLQGLPSAKMGRKVRFLKSEIIEWLKSPKCRQVKSEPVRRKKRTGKKTPESP